MKTIDDEMIKKFLTPTVWFIIISTVCFVFAILTDFFLISIEKKFKTHYHDCGTFVKYIIRENQTKYGKTRSNFDGFMIQVQNHQQNETLYFDYYHDFHQHLNIKKQDLQVGQNICVVYFKPTFGFLHGDAFLVDLKKNDLQ